MKASYLFLLLILCGCAKELSIPVDQCKLEIEHSGTTHPKADAFQALLNKYVEKGLPGVAMVVYTPEEGKWIGSAGVARIENQQAMLPCNIFHSASVAKTYHVVAAMTLVEEGKLQLDNTIDHYLPDWVCNDLPNKSTATVRQLMNHTSGIPDFIEDTEHVLDYFNDLLHRFTTEEYLDYVCGDDPDFQSGTSVSYSNTNTVLLALIMDQIAGNHATLITERIIQPLGLSNTYYKQQAGYPAPTGVVNTYVDVKENGILINSSEIERNFADMSIGHDGMLASPHDYFLFIRALFKGTLLSDTSLSQMMDFKPYSASIDMGEGLGLDIVKTPLKNLTRAGHNGGSLGAANNVFYYPEKDATIVICSNFGGFLDGPLSQLFYSPLIGNQRTLLGEIELLLFGE
ncbi:MAG: beta-lactamase family protein [Chitinophagales bacterium]|nr:beta-lactamase family protein [Chitinophagales bacterium]